MKATTKRHNIKKDRQNQIYHKAQKRIISRTENIISLNREGLLDILFLRSSFIVLEVVYSSRMKYFWNLQTSKSEVKLCTKLKLLLFS